MARGGERTPSNPAPVSGPGALSKRTDGPQGGGSQPVRVASGGAYGERQESIALQQAAPMAASEGGAAAEPVDITAGLIGFGEPSQSPGMPVTAGAAAGPGPGLSALNLPSQQRGDMAELVKFLPVFEHMANAPGSSKAARNLVRQIKAYAV